MKNISSELITFSRELLKCDKKIIDPITDKGHELEARESSILEIICQHCSPLYSSSKTLLTPIICDKEKILSIDSEHIDSNPSAADRLRFACTSIGLESIDWIKNMSCNWQELSKAFEATDDTRIGFFLQQRF